MTEYTQRVLIVAALLLLAVPCSAQVKRDDFFKPYGRGFVASSASYWSGALFDDLKTRQCIAARTCVERNPLLRTRTGEYRFGRALALDAAGYGVTLLIEKKWPKLASYIRFGAGGAHALAGGRNW